MIDKIVDYLPEGPAPITQYSLDVQTHFCTVDNNTRINAASNFIADFVMS